MSRVQSSYSNSELVEREYIKTCGEAGVTTIIDSWMDSAPKDLPPEVSDIITASLRIALAALSDLEAAEWAASLCGNQDFETWLSNQ